MGPRVAIILAAGISSRMFTQLPKVLHEVCGREMLAYVLDACRAAGVQKIYAVVGYGAGAVQERFADAGDVVWVEQAEQKGTAHAALCCKQHLADFDGQTLILNGDAPLIRAGVLRSLVETYEQAQPAAALATAVLDDPTGYGRIVRDADGNIEAIIEHNDCTDELLRIKEINPSYFLFNNKILFEALEEVRPDNVKGEYYLTDAVGIILSKGYKVVAVTAVRPEEAVGVNDRRQLAAAGKIMQRRIQKELMDSGVTIVDPDNTWIDARAQIGQDTIIEPFSYIHGRVRVGNACHVGPFAFLRDGAVLEDNAVFDVFTKAKSSARDKKD